MTAPRRRRRRLSAESRKRARRNAAIARQYRAGATLAQLGAQYGLTETGIWRVLDRGGWRLSPEEVRQRRTGTSGGRRPIWPDCPAHLQHDYRKARAVIGSHAAKAQLLAAEARHGRVSGANSIRTGGITS